MIPQPARARPTQKPSWFESPPALRGLVVNTARSDAHSEAAFLPGAPWKAAPRSKCDAHAFLDQPFSSFARNTPSRVEFQAVLFDVNVPLNRDVPALRDAQSLEYALGRDFGGDIFAYDLADNQLQSESVFALLLLGHIMQQALHGQGLAGPAGAGGGSFPTPAHVHQKPVAERGAVYRNGHRVLF